MSFVSGRNTRFVLIATLCLCLIPCGIADAQRSTDASTTGVGQKKVAAPAIPGDAVGDSVISPDDVLDVYVMDVAELSRQYRVNPAGKVVLPLLSDPLPAAGLTQTEFAKEVASQLRDKGLVTDAHIVVTIVSSRLKSVAITGAVKMPQIYPVFGKTTLLDVLSQAQGLADDAGNVAIVSRGEIGEQATGQTTQSANIKKLLQDANPSDNIEIYPGDRVTVPHAGVVYVVGAVNKPGGFVMKASNGITVLQALAMAEDAKLNSVKTKAVVIRPDPKAPEGHEQIPVNLNLVLQGKQPDLVMIADDILYIPESASKRAFRNIGQAALQAATLAVVYRP